MRRQAFVLILAVLAAGQSGIAPPKLGFIRDGNLRLRPVFGVAANLITGPAMGADVLSAALSSGRTWLKTEDRLSVLDSGGGVICEMPAPGGPALFGRSGAGEITVIFYPQASELRIVRHCGAAATPLRLADVSGEVLSLAAAGQGRAALLVRRDAQLWLAEVSLATGLVEHEVPVGDSRGPALILPDKTLVVAAGAELVVRRHGRSEQRLPVDSPVADVAEAGEGWIQVVTHDDDGSRASFLLRLTGERGEVYRLPEAAS